MKMSWVIKVGELCNHESWVSGLWNYENELGKLGEVSYGIMNGLIYRQMYHNQFRKHFS